MVLRTPSEDDPLLPTDVDLSQIFIGREQQLDLFRVYLERWQRQLPATSPQLSMPPSPNNKLQGLVILLHGRGGFGKTVLLKHFHEIALAYEQELHTSTIVDWEFAVAGNRPLFSPAPGEHVDASRYFALLRDQLALALAKRPDEFKEYQSAVKDVDEAKRRARGVLESLQGESHYAWLRGLAGEGVLALVRLIPKSEVVLSQGIAEKIKEIAGDGAQIGVAQIKQVWERLHDHLGTKLDDYLNQTMRLGQGLGSDLAHFAKRYPILLFFDTYEEIDEADDLLRIVMGAAGGRVGWVIAGRDNLWAGLSQRLRSQDTVYGYKDIVPYHLGWSVDFSADGVGDFILSDIQHYFAQLSELARPMLLPALSEKDAEYLLHVTKGVPLAIRIAASLYLEKPDLRLLLEGSESKREIVDQMVRRYLLHTRTNEADKARLYGLALLRRAEEPKAVCAALDLPPATSYRSELMRLQRRYGFVFTKQEVPSLHQEVRHFLRLWLLEHHSEPGIAAVIHRLKQAHEEALQELETTRGYASIRARLEDDQWVECYIDLTEQYFWQDSAQGVAFVLPFMCAASIYRREANREVFAIGTFFEVVIHRPYHTHWQWAARSLRYTTSRHPLPDEIAGLQDLVKLARQSTLAFLPPLPSAQRELEAALWCRLGEAYRGMQEEEALYWYEKGLSQLVEETEQSEEVLKTLLEVDIEEKKQEPSFALEEGYKPDAERQEQSQTTESASSRLEQSSGSARTQLNQLQVNKSTTRKKSRRQLHSSRSTVVGGLSRRRVIVGSAGLGLVAVGSGLTWWILSSSNTHNASNLFYTYHGHSDVVTGVTWLPDDTRIASASYDQTVQVWDAANGNHVYTYRGHTGRVTCVARSPDGMRIASGSDDQTVQVWDAASGDHVYTYRGHTNNVHCVAWSPDGTRIASASSDNTVQVWNAQDGGYITLHRDPTRAWTVVWSPDGTHIASGSENQAVQVWDATNGNHLLTYSLHSGAITRVAWSPDGTRIASASADYTVQVWNARDGKHLLTYKGHSLDVWTVSWSPNGMQIVSGSVDSTVQVWDATNGDHIYTYPGHSNNVRSAVWSPDGMRIASGSGDSTVQVWKPMLGGGPAFSPHSARNARNLQYVYHGHSDRVASVTWSPNNTRIASASYDQTVQVWNATNGENVYNYRGHSSWVLGVAWSPDGKRIASGSQDQTVRVWDAANGDHVYIYRGHTDNVHCVAWSPDGTRIASGSADATAQVWNAQDGSHVLTYHSLINCIAWSPDNTRIVTGSQDQTVQVWDAQNGNRLLEYDLHSRAINCVAWSPDGIHIASGSSDYTVQVWDVRDGKHLLTYKGHSDRVWAVVWSLDGKRIASGSEDGTVQVWDAQNGGSLLTYGGSSGDAVAWSPDGTYIASGGYYTTVQVWKPT